ncbi:MAG: hypothetical protein WCT23_03040 [Candidatus Neomarinimicrobiota bacterium]
MTQKVKTAVVEKMKKRYQKADKKGKSQLLDELCEMCDYHLKHAIRLLNATSKKTKHLPASRGAPKQYDDPQILEALKYIYWKLNLPCSRRLKAALPNWLPFYETSKGIYLAPDVKEKLLKISAASIDRLLKSHRRPAEKLGLCTTKPGTILKKHIPILTDQWDETRPGYMEADTVAHCGSSVAGSFVYTLNMVDIATGWHEQRAVWEKGLFKL